VRFIRRSGRTLLADDVATLSQSNDIVRSVFFRGCERIWKGEGKGSGRGERDEGLAPLEIMKSRRPCGWLSACGRGRTGEVGRHQKGWDWEAGAAARVVGDDHADIDRRRSDRPRTEISDVHELCGKLFLVDECRRGGVSIIISVRIASSHLLLVRVAIVGVRASSSVLADADIATDSTRLSQLTSSNPADRISRRISDNQRRTSPSAGTH